MFSINVLVLIGTLLSTSSGKIILKKESENLLYKCLSDILPNFEATNYALTNFDLRHPSIPKVLINFDVNIKISITYCPKIALFDLRDLKKSEALDYFEKINCGLSTTIVIITKQSNYQYRSLKDYVLYVLDEKLDFKYVQQVFSPKTSIIKIMYRDLPPFTDSETNNGVEEIIVRLLLKQLSLNSTVEFERELRPIGKNATTGNYTNLPLLLLQYGLVDLVAGGFHPSVNDMYKDFQHSIVYAMDTLNLISPKSEVKPIGKRVMQIFPWELNIIFVIVSMLVLFFIKYFYKAPSVFIIIMWFYQILLEGSVYNIQKKCTFRLPMSFILIAYLIVVTASKNILTLIYFTNEYEPEIHSYEDMIESGLNIYARHLNATKDTDMLADKLKICEDILECFQRVAYRRDYLLLFQKIPVLYNTPRYFTNNQTKEPLLYIGASFQQVPYQMYFRRNFPVFDDINNLLIRIYEAGFIEAEANKKKFYFAWISSLSRKINSRVLNFAQLKFTFNICLVGLIGATLTFCGEIYIHKICN